MPKFELQPNQEIVRERKIVLHRVRIKKYPEMRAQVFEQTGKNEGDPVNAVAEFHIYDDPQKDMVNYTTALFPVNVISNDEPVVGMWWASEEEFEKDKDEFMRRVQEEMHRLKFVVQEKRGFGI